MTISIVRVLLVSALVSAAVGSLHAQSSETNSPPIVTSRPPTRVVTSAPFYRYEVDTYDPDQDSLTFTLPTYPAGMTIDSNGEVLWNLAGVSPGNYTVHVQVTDGRGGKSSQKWLIQVIAAGGTNLPPTITSSPPIDAQAGVGYFYRIKAFDPEGDPLRFTLVAGPPGMTIDSATGEVRWTPTATDVGTAAVRVSVQDSAGNMVEQAWTITVKPARVNRPPVITSTPPTTLTAPATYRYQVTATDPDGDRITYSLVEGPNGMTIDPTTGELTWPAGAGSAGVYDVRVRATDTAGNTTEQKWQITVTEPGVDCTAAVCGDGRIQSECGEVCDGAVACSGSSSASGAFAQCVDNCRRLDDSTCTVRPEICGNCQDDNGDGLTDFEDPACCSLPRSVLSLSKGLLASTRTPGTTTLRVQATLGRRPTFAPDPLNQDVYIQLRQPGHGELLCAWLPARKFMKMGKNRIAYWDRVHPPASARGITDMAVLFPRSGEVRARITGRRVLFGTPASGSLLMTVAYLPPAGGPGGSLCTSASQPFVAKAKKVPLRR